MNNDDPHLNENELQLLEYLELHCNSPDSSEAIKASSIVNDLGISEKRLAKLANNLIGFDLIQGRKVDAGIYTRMWITPIGIQFFRKSQKQIDEEALGQQLCSNQNISDTSTFDPTNKILNILYNTGIEIERHPSVHKGKDEETLRDHFLVGLSPHFQSVSGETFNKSGKTDILIRHEGKNLFVAECAIWKGPKHFLGKIDQLLSYLTWRDTKAALICFVKIKDIEKVLKAIEKQIPNHSCFLKDLGKENEGWLRFQFKLSEDESRTVFLSVLVFYFP